ncbi:carboxylating nicotinate-nucleotide diphosphorylase [Methanothermobacter wolfeii]|uniref:Nicotinate-nucleotide pyrophosphorylase [carboxylating] n=1 Tax=Methanothermobacter wolfeii TaxID=145261 RepID=A0A9E7UH73_METWO|nr:MULTISPECIES: carboxylating nicotinate-nucleotide diphosphorylase [Methanothermobacter]NLM01803.1 carboxylating nicotinate-nucleotide diphosphorylase [Methanothermobacter wolfeii]QHN05910.1 carboxylating nicotinate-nucleotide diphosphorylase [Methanothermobacter sp. THM-1]UXH32074.1 carboxylating nicotinate-nucleotide diphosphorylase [Methanothermobacter wolfeii]SCM56167.1 putative nicotinate-nucleotide pyrophosphorylase [Methanothermobacter wolfeii]
MIDVIREMIREDVGFEDITTDALIDRDMTVKADVISREEGVLAGVDVAEVMVLDFGIEIIKWKHDGDTIKEGDRILTLEGRAYDILKIERTMLNLMMRMSGIATLTARVLSRARRYSGKVRIAATRKTTPGLQWFEKQAVKIGGGDTHRFRLDDCAMIKDNHIAIVGDVEEAVKRVREHVSFTKKVEVEVESPEDAVTAAEAGADIVLLDNMSPEVIEHIVGELKRRGLRDRVILEASGGIKPENIDRYASTGVDVISMGFITNSAQPVDLSLEIRAST